MKILSQASFQTLAGDAAYARGVEYYNNGQVGALTIDGSQISAEVHGEQTYQVLLHHTARQFDGSCTCKASDNFDFCKHCVAASLAYYYQTQTNQELADSANQDPVLPYLNTFTKPQLVEELNRLVQADSALYEHWLLRAEIAGGSLNASDLRKRITKAIRYKPSGLWRYAEVASYFDAAERSIRALEPAISLLAPNEAIKLVVYAVERTEKTLETIDDSGGHREHLERFLATQFGKLMADETWPDDEKVSLICKLILSEKFDYDLLNLPTGAVSSFNDQSIETIYIKLQQAWTKLTPPTKDALLRRSLYTRLEGLLLENARRKNNVTVELDILAKGAVDTDRCLKLVEICIRHKRLDEAEKWLEYASKVQHLRPYDVAAIETQQISLWLAKQDYTSALAAQWARFEESEAPEDLVPVLKTAHKLECRNEYLNRAIALLDTKIERKVESPRNRQRAQNLVEIYLANMRVGSAIKLANHHTMHPGIWMAVVNAAPEQSAATARLIEKAVASLINLGGNETYERANWFLQKLYAKSSTKDQAVIKAAILDIYNRPENKRKTNFIKGLKSNFDFI